MARQALTEATFFTKIPESPQIFNIGDIYHYYHPGYAAAHLIDHLYENPKVNVPFSLDIEAETGVHFLLAAVMPPKV